MSMVHFILINLALIFAVLGVKKHQDNETYEFTCDDTMESEIDKSITRLIVVGQKNTRFPSNERELRPYCNLALHTFGLVAAYTRKCIPDFGMATANVFMYGIGNELKGICKSGKLSKRARALLAAAPCANAGLDNWQKCNSQLIEKFTGIVNAPIKMRIPMGCCNFHQLVQCLTEEAEEVKACSKKTIDFLTKYAHKIIDPIVLILCNEYSEPSDRCDRMVRLTPNRTKTQKKYHSFIKPLINIGLSLANDPQFAEKKGSDRVGKS